MDSFLGKEKKKAIITGITGQDGSYLAEFLLNKGYEVHGLIRRVALEDQNQRLGRINHIKDNIIIHSGSVEDYPRIMEIIDEVKPDECYHLAAQSFVKESFDDPSSTFNTNIYGTLNMLRAILRKSPQTKFYFAGSSEMFGKVKEIPQTEKTPFYPKSPYGISKITGFHMVRNYRESFNIFACSGILFNHESPRRGKEFVTRKITSFVEDIKKDPNQILELGNLDSKRDWGFSGDYVEAMWLMLQQEEPDDYVIATGETHTVKEFVEEAFKVGGIFPIKWEGVGINEVGMYGGKLVVKVNKKFFRPAEVDLLIGDSSKAKEKLGWRPKTNFKELVGMMVEGDLKNLRNETLLNSER
jgi:GDPmannose 4,6-dehydratase